MNVSEETLKNGMILLHPERRKIINLLKESGKPLFINEIADKTKIERRLVSYHLSTLEDNGFAKSEFQVIEPPHSKGKAGRFYRLTDKVDTSMKALVELLQKK